MMTTLERRHGERARIPCKIAVALTDEEESEPFEANAVDLSVGGLSLRAPKVPAVGSQLSCSFEAVPGGAQVLGRGEVVWSQTAGESGGEFGLRFTEIDPRAQALLDEMVAERIARIEPPFAGGLGDKPVVANLEIENVESPIAARLVHQTASEALFEQPLDLLALGRGVVAHAGLSLVRGRIGRVEVRMQGGTPMLALAVQLDQPDKQFGEFDWEDTAPDTQPDLFVPTELGAPVAAADSSENENESDDEDDEAVDEDRPSDPDAQADSSTLSGLGAVWMLAPERVERADRMSRHAPMPRDTDLDFDAHDAHEARGSRVRDDDDLDDGYLGDEEYDSDEDESDPYRAEAPTAANPMPGMIARRERDQLSLRFSTGTGTEQPRGSTGPGDELDAEAERFADAHFASGQLHDPGAGLAARKTDDEEDWTELPDSVRSPILVRVLRVFAMLVQALQAPTARVRELFGGVFGEARQHVVQSGRRMLAQVRPRRITVAANHHDEENRGGLRLIGIGVMSIAAVALFAYALAPAHHADQHGEALPAEANEPADALAAETESGDDPTGALPASETTATLVAAKGGAAPAGLGQNARSAAAAARPAVAPASNVPTFGARQVPNAKRFLLRMNAPVRALNGSPSEGGFSVVVPNNKAKDRAAPIREGHPLVDKAAILNHRDGAELTIRFAPGKAPPYRVSAQGAALEILIGN